MRIGWVLLVLGIGGLAFAIHQVTSGPAEGAAPPGMPPYVLPVTLATIERADFSAQLELTGSVRSRRSARLAFETRGRIVALPALEGQRVEAGALLARLKDDDLRLALAAAEANLALSRTELQKLEAGAREEEKRRLEADLAEARARAAFAAADLSRAQSLREQDVGSQAQVERLEAERLAAEARVAATQAALDQARAGTRAEDLAIARARVAVAETAVRTAGEELAKAGLRAPWNGVVVARERAEGDHVDVGDVVLELVDLDQREIVIEVPSRWAPSVRAGAAVRVRLDEAPQFALAARVRALVPAADERSRNFRALVDVDPGADPDLVLAPGVFARLTVDLAPIAGALVVPSDCVRMIDAGPIVVRAKPNPPAEPAPGGMPAPPFGAEWVPVRVLASSGGKSAIESLGPPIAAGESVVLTGVDIAFPGAPLLPRVDPPAAPQGGGAPR